MSEQHPPGPLISVRRLRKADLPAFAAHFSRHRAESGRGDVHFMPFEPDDPAGPQGLDASALELPLFVTGWQRWFVACAGIKIVGHVNLKGAGLKTQLHRCELGLGIERGHRGEGLGRRLAQTAIDFAREAPTLAWLDLRVFGHNRPARALYASLGFREVGRLDDCFRIEGRQVDDVLMTLDVSG